MSLEIKWSRNLKRHAEQKQQAVVSLQEVGRIADWPFGDRFVAASNILLDEAGWSLDLNKVEGRAFIAFPFGPRLDFSVVATLNAPNYGYYSLDPCQYLVRFRFGKVGEKIDNITDWALSKFTAHYGKPAKVTKDAIFAYVYGVVHDPIYRETYAQNLKREFHRIPFYPDFVQWQAWRQRLLSQHIGYESVTPWPLTRFDIPDTRAAATGMAPKAALKAGKAAGTITLDSETTLSGIPPKCWDYKLGNRSGLEWILDQYKAPPKYPTIRAKFNTYRFADYKPVVIDLLCRVTRVSVEAMAVTTATKQVPRT